MATWVITGANRGIGLEVVRQVAGRGDDVFAVCRSPSKELESVGQHVTVVSGVDVTSADAAARIAKALGERMIDVLFHNAGILLPGGLESLDVDVIRKQFEVNAIAPIRITHGLVSKLGSGAKVCVVSSFTTHRDALRANAGGCRRRQ